MSIVTKAVHYISRFLYGRYVDVKFAPSDLAAEYTFGKKAVAKGQVAQLHNAVDLNIYHYYPEERISIRKELGIEGKKVIGHIGRFMHQKNHSFLLDIFNEIKKKEPNAVLLLVGGNGDLEPMVRQKISDLRLEDSVVFAGIRSDIPQLLSAMDVFVMPSFYEGMPNTVIEAQATGLPCIISDTITKQANITDLVEYLPLSEPTSIWADRAIAVINDTRKETKQNFIDNKYDIEGVAKQFVKLVFNEE
ncbi:MAG: glycosyltransferase [Clostridia bacterium]|nr:glycosyltransferase [Clostridia bacterium]